MFKRNQNERGFTLIELLVVVAIIGLLASVIIASLATAREKARDAQRISDINQIQTGLELYYGSCTDYPTAFTGTGSSCTGASLSDFLDPEIFTDPEGRTYYYVATGTAESYCLGTDLEDENHAQENGTSSCASSATMPSGTETIDYAVHP